MNPHKWLFVPVDLSVLYTRRPEVVRAAFSLVPDYLRTAEEAVAPNLMDYGVSLGRRFRALKLWMVMRAFGHEGLAARIREHVRLAQVFRAWVEADPAFEVVAPSPLSVVCFRARFPDGLSPEEADRAQRGRSWTPSTPPARPTSRTRSSAAAPCCAWPSATCAPRSATCAGPGSGSGLAVPGATFPWSSGRCAA